MSFVREQVSLPQVHGQDRPMRRARGRLLALVLDGRGESEGDGGSWSGFAPD